MPEVGETFFAEDRETWRAWLAEHHRDKGEIWLLFCKKHTGEPCVSYDAAVEEALCFGWIDGILKRVDDRQHVVRFSPRKPRSRWSDSNRRRVRALIASEKMTEAGMELVRAAKESGAWQRAGKRTATPPPDLAAALARNRRAQRNFDGFARSYRESYVAWVIDAKREETRRKRVREVVRRSARGIKPGIAG